MDELYRWPLTYFAEYIITIISTRYDLTKLLVKSDVNDVNIKQYDKAKKKYVSLLSHAVKIRVCRSAFLFYFFFFIYFFLNSCKSNPRAHFCHPWVRITPLLSQ